MDNKLLKQELIQLSNLYKICIGKLYNNFNVPCLTENNFEKEVKLQKYFLDFYVLLKETDNFNNTFNMYEFLKAQGGVIYPAQLKNKTCLKKFITYIKNKENQKKVENFVEEKETIKQKIKESLELIQVFLEENNIKYANFYCFKKNENDLMPFAFFLIVQNKITPYLYSFDQKFIDAFELLPADYQTTYNYLLEDAAKLREAVREKDEKLFNFILKLVEKMKEQL